MKKRKELGTWKLGFPVSSAHIRETRATAAFLSRFTEKIYRGIGWTTDIAVFWEISSTVEMEVIAVELLALSKGCSTGQTKSDSVKPNQTKSGFFFLFFLKMSSVEITKGELVQGPMSKVGDRPDTVLRTLSPTGSDLVRPNPTRSNRFGGLPFRRRERERGRGGAV
jgi:hypothetical protein